MLSIILDVGLYWPGVELRPIFRISLVVVRIGLSIPALDRLLHEQAEALKLRRAR